MKKKTPFRIAAERFAEGKYNFNKKEIISEQHIRSKFDHQYYGACEALYNEFNKRKAVGEEVHRDFFYNTMHPTESECVEFRIYNIFWLSSTNRLPEQNLQDRILALLFCEQLWLDEQKRNP